MLQVAATPAMPHVPPPMTEADAIRHRVVEARNLLNTALEDAAVEGITLTVKLLHWNPVGCELLGIPSLVQVDIQPFLPPEEVEALERAQLAHLKAKWEQ